MFLVPSLVTAFSFLRDTAIFLLSTAADFLNREKQLIILAVLILALGVPPLRFRATAVTKRAVARELAILEYCSPIRDFVQKENIKLKSMLSQVMTHAMYLVMTVL